MGVKAGVFNEETGKLNSLKMLADDNDVMLITAEGVIIRIRADEIRKIGRDTKGVKVMNIKDNNMITSVAVVPHEEDEPETQFDAEGNPIVPETVEGEGEQAEADEEGDVIVTESPAVDDAEIPADIGKEKLNDDDLI
jgi:DNA gyrase subunit A